MKLNTSKSQVSTSGSLDTQQATIELNSTTIHVLSRDLYSRPIEAVLREILTNAIDAHIEANQSKPVVIKLPTAFDEQFYIRDYGVGLDHPTLQGIYLAYGKSTRRDTDIAHGGFGLGTKSPLAYTTAFSVTSFKDGIKNSYLVYYDEDNLPCLDHRESDPTDEENGLLVSFSTVSAYDYINFRQAAEKILSRIPQTLYKLEDSEEDSWAPKNGFKLPEGTTYGPLVFRASNKPSITIVMGCVGYEFNHEAVLELMSNMSGKSSTIRLGDGENDINSYELLDTILQHNTIEVNAKIGDYPIHPSREYINVTPRAVKKCISHIQEGINALTTNWNNDDNTLLSDIMQFQLIGKVNPKIADDKLRARFIAPSDRTYYSPRISLQLGTYYDVVKSTSEYSGSILVKYLSPDDLTDYLGNGRSRYTFPDDFPAKTAVLFVDKDRVPDWFDNIIAGIKCNYDFSTDIEKYKEQQQTIREQEEERSQLVKQRRAQRTVVRSMQDPKHNVLIFNNNGNGAAKRCWESAKHSVETLRAEKRPIFYAATRMGCIENRSTHPGILETYNSIYTFMPKHKRPIIVGLPASKGTLAFTRTFKPLDDLPAYIKAFFESPYAQRRKKFNTLISYINSEINTSNIDSFRVYGPVDKLYRLYNLRYKYNINNAPYNHKVDTSDVNYEPEIKKLIDDICVRFPQLDNSHTRWYYHTSGELEKKQKIWAQQVADMLNAHPTSAIFKNRKEQVNKEEE